MEGAAWRAARENAEPLKHPRTTPAACTWMGRRGERRRRSALLASSSSVPHPRPMGVPLPAPDSHPEGAGVGTLGSTRTWKEQVALVPEASVAVTVTGVIPSGKDSPEAWL
jgi:hypothetical protein